jgi:nucleotide-binding universal stress UspA family protein
MPSVRANARLLETTSRRRDEQDPRRNGRSDSAAEAVEFGIELAAEHEAELIFVHVVPEADLVPTTLLGRRRVPSSASIEDRTLLEEAAAVAEEHDVRSTTELLAGDAVDEIVAYADSHNVDLIVVGSRGHGTIANALLGSVSRGVLAASKRPVLVVRGAASIRHSADVRRPAGIGLGF